MNIAGHATAKGTDEYCRRFLDRFDQGHFHSVEKLRWSSIGLGTYLGKPDAKTDKLVAKAVIQSIEGGINVIDTAINYRRQHGEKSIGAALRNIVTKGKYNRDEFIVCTKGGFLPHPDGSEWFQSQYVDRFKDVIQTSDLVANCHCMHPSYLSDQLNRSLENLGLQTIDVYYVHNPETQLGSVEEDIFYHRMEAAFEMLEEAVAKRKIRYYGLATWSGFRVMRSNAKYMMLSRLKELARQVAGDGPDHFRFIQLPLNLEMPEAFSVANQRVDDNLCSTLSAANSLGIYPVISGSIAQGNIKHLSSFQKKKLGDGFTSDAQRALNITRSAPGIACALIGMKQTAHIEENLQLCSFPLLESDIFEVLLRDG